MNSILDGIKDWEERAEQSQYQVGKLAETCRISVRQLRNYVRLQFRSTPHSWMMRLRLQRAAALLERNNSVKQVSLEMGFRQAAHFSREFKRLHGLSPVAFRKLRQMPPTAGIGMKLPI